MDTSLATTTEVTDIRPGMRVTVMGLGRFGGGVGVTRWLASRGACITITDIDPPASLRDSLVQIDDLVSNGAVTLQLGGHALESFTACDLVVANPAVPQPWKNQFLRASVEAGVPITTEIRLVTERLNRNRVIGITGSAGKSTTTAMVHHMLRRAGIGAQLGGNIGGSLLNTVEHLQADDWIVLELSSAMLYWLGENPMHQSRGWSPHIAVITNITPNHIDWHGSFEHYRASKQNIFRYQSGEDHLIEGSDISLRVPITLAIPGEHNQRNAAVAKAVVACAVGATSAETATRTLAEFKGLPHRLQLVAEHDGCRFYNDSKSTTPEATMLAIEAFSNPACVHLIAGGYDKGSDLSSIATAADRVAGVYAIGATGKAIVNAASASAKFITYCETLEKAVATARQRMQPPDVLLLSPGCASWDQFTNFEARGERFTSLVAAS